MSLEIEEDPAAARNGAGSGERFSVANANKSKHNEPQPCAQEQKRDSAAVKRARLVLLFDSVYEQMQAVHHQADLVMLFAETEDHRGVNRQLTFLVEAIGRAVQSSAEIRDLKSERAV